MIALLKDLERTKKKVVKDEPVVTDKKVIAQDISKGESGEEILQQIRKREHIFNDSQQKMIDNNTEFNIDTFLETEIEECNYFLKNNKMNTDLPNLMWAFKSCMRTVLFRPILKFENDTNSFILKKIKDATYTINCFGKHMPLFISFDNNRMPSDRWSIHDIGEKEVQILLRVDPKDEKSMEVMNAIKKSVSQAKNEGWAGSLSILIVSTIPIDL